MGVATTASGPAPCNCAPQATASATRTAAAAERHTPPRRSPGQSHTTSASSARAARHPSRTGSRDRSVWPTPSRQPPYSAGASSRCARTRANGASGAAAVVGRAASAATGW
jgi:hypothetical protein